MICKRSICLSLFWGICVFTTGTGFSSALIDPPIIPASFIIQTHHDYCAPVTYRDHVYLYSHTSNKLTFSSSDFSLTTIATPFEIGMKTISDDLLLARLEDNIVLLLDTKEERAVKLFGGIHNNSPRLATVNECYIGDYRFSLATNTETKAKEITVTTPNGSWSPVRISGSPRLQSFVNIGDMRYSVCNESLCIRHSSDENVEKVHLGKGAQTPVLISEANGLLAVALRERPTDGSLVIFDAQKKMIVATMKVDGYALAPTILNNKLVVNCYTSHRLFVFEVGDIVSNTTTLGLSSSRTASKENWQQRSQVELRSVV